VSRLRRSKRRAKRVWGAVSGADGASEASVTGLAGLAGVQELIVGLDMVGALDAGIGPVKQRDRGVSGGQLLMGMATAQLAGQDCLAGLDTRVRADAGSALLTTAPVPPSTTAASIAGRFTPDRVAGIETGLGRVYRRWLAVGPASVRAALVLRNPTIDLDASDVEVFGRTKRNVGWTYAGVRAGRVHLASWAPVNSVWMWAGLLAGATSVMLQALTGPDPRTGGRTRIATLRHRLLAVPGRLIPHDRGLTLRLPPDRHQLLSTALARLRALPATT